ncbi:uncharacterized protein LOC134547043 isoform X2 [Prinia subflava]|uniref:uncharacterized protein LOC134547043 isoform X2 n=1 Tax=Prinia subflava TaxID=208062 RepID=UPI002FE16374
MATPPPLAPHSHGGIGDGNGKRTASSAPLPQTPPPSAPYKAGRPPPRAARPPHAQPAAAPARLRPRRRPPAAPAGSRPLSRLRGPASASRLAAGSVLSMAWTPRPSSAPGAALVSHSPSPSFPRRNKKPLVRQHSTLISLEWDAGNSNQTKTYRHRVSPLWQM